MYNIYVSTLKNYTFSDFFNIVQTLSFLQQLEQVNPIFGAFSLEILGLVASRSTYEENSPSSPLK